MTVTHGQSTTFDSDTPLSSGGGRLESTLERTVNYVSAVVMGGVRYVEANMVPVALCAAIMFPAYWFVWKFLFPQPYENLSIRLLGSLLCLVVAAKDRWPLGCRRYLPIVWLGTVLYSGPFFFTFMLLQNNNSTVWLLSTMAGLFLVILLLDWISLFVLFIAGSVLAWRIHLMVSPEIAAVGLYMEFVPIFLFALTAGTIFNYKAAGLRQAKERARMELGALLAKEMQAPLVTMRTNAASLGKFLPMLIGAHPDGAQPKADAATVTTRQRGALERVPARIEEAIEQMGGIIEVLMTEGGEAGASHQRASSILRCLDDAIARLPLSTEVDRARIVIDRQGDFLFNGSPALMVHVLARVLDASLHEVYTETGGELVVTLGRASEQNYLKLADSLSELRANRFFLGFWRRDRDFANRPDLALANFVLGRLGGSVARIATGGRTRETVLWFPQPGA
ncbi:MAG TPA: hypothetical protein VET85_17250 [Stellaceae bacterium]|nr:hypothetical protein [Stellaceae bacterium]